MKTRARRAALAGLLALACAPGEAAAQQRFALSEEGSRALGGSREKYLLVDQDQRPWIFKPMLASEAYTEEACFRLARLAGLPTPEAVQARAQRGIWGSLTRRVDAVGNLKDRDPARLDQRQLGQLLEIEVFRWFLGDFDSHARNFLEMPGGDIWTIDHGRAWRDQDYFRYDLATGPSRDRISYFADLWRAHRAGRIQLPLERGVAFASRFAALPWEAFEAILRPLARMRMHERGFVLADHLGVRVYRDPDEFLFAVRRRKQRLVEDVRAYYRRLAGRDVARSSTTGPTGFSGPEGWSGPTTVAAAAPRRSTGRPLDIDVDDPRGRLTSLQRLKRKAQYMATLVRDAGPGKVARRLLQLADNNLDGLEYRLSRVGRRGLSLEQVATLDLGRLPGGRRFLDKLRASDPEVVERLRERVAFLSTRAETEVERANAERLAGWIEHLFP